jgi:hypothetical protein
VGSPTPDNNLPVAGVAIVFYQPTRLIGKEAMSALSGSSFDFDQLKGMEVEVEIRHIITDKSENYDYPFVKVSDIQKPGTMGLPEPEPQPELVEEEDDSKEVSCY